VIPDIRRADATLAFKVSYQEGPQVLFLTNVSSTINRCYDAIFTFKVSEQEGLQVLIMSKVSFKKVSYQERPHV
jgi:hypothetical protein